MNRRTVRGRRVRRSHRLGQRHTNLLRSTLRCDSGSTLRQQPGLVLAALLSGCWVHEFQTGRPRGGAVHDEGAFFALWGLVPNRDFDLDVYCPEGAAYFKNEQTFLDGLLGTVTLGILTHRTVTIECAGTGARP